MSPAILRRLDQLPLLLGDDWLMPPIIELIILIENPLFCKHSVLYNSLGWLMPPADLSQVHLVGQNVDNATEVLILLFAISL